MKSSLDRSWVVLAAISAMICISMALPIYGGSVANTYMAVALGWSRQTLGLLIAVNMVVNALSAPLAAVAVGKIGARSSMMIGSVILGLAGVILATCVSQPWQAVVAFSVLVGLAGGLAGVIPCQTAVATWFEDRRTMALSIMYAAQGIGGFAAVFLINRAIGVNAQWRSGWWVFAAAGVIGLVVAIIFIRNAPDGVSPSQEKQPPPGAQAPSVATREETFAQALRAPLMWAICLSMLTVMAGSGFIMAHSQVFLRGIGFTPSTAAWAISLMSLSMVAGNLGFGALAPRLGLRATYLMALAIFSLGLLVLSLVHGMMSLWAYAIIVGIGFGASQVGAMAMLGHYWPMRLFPALTATGLMIQTVGGGAVPIVAGAYFDAHQSYLPVIWALAVVNLGAMLILGLLSGQKAAAVVASPAE